MAPITRSNFNYNALFRAPDLLATYSLLLCSFVACYVFKSYFARGIVFLLAILFALNAGVIDWIGFTIIIVLGSAMYFAYQLQNKMLRGFSFLIALILSIGIVVIRPIPGIHNWPVISKMILSENAIPYSMWFTFDKSLIGLFFIAFSSYSLANGGKWFPVLRTGIVTGIIASLVLIPLSIYLGYVTFDLKIKNFLWLWMLNNLFFVCIAEEALFRGMIQKFLMLRMQHFRGGRWIALGIAAVLFGLAHYKGGINYILLSTVAGCFYGYAFMRTDKIEASVLTHFIVNLIHFIGFTYPAIKIMAQ